MSTCFDVIVCCSLKVRRKLTMAFIQQGVCVENEREERKEKGKKETLFLGNRIQTIPLCFFSSWFRASASVKGFK